MARPFPESVTDDARLTPAGALEAIGSIRLYRERLTPQAAGTVWLVWGLALAAVGTLGGDLSAIAYVGLLGMIQVLGPWLADLALLGAAVVTTNAIWRSHALERGTEHPAWIAWVVATVVAVGVLGLGVAAGIVYLALFGGQIMDFRVLALPLATAAAVALAVMQRTRVPAGPGLLAGALLFIAQFVLPAVALVTSYQAYTMVMAWDRLWVILAFGAVGLWHLRRG